MWHIGAPHDEQPRRSAAPHAGRRSLLRGSLFAGIDAIGLVALGSLVRLLDSTDQAQNEGLVHVAAGDIPQPGADPSYFAKGRFYLVNLRPGEGGIQASLGSPRGGLIALAAKCPHRGSTLPWRPQFEFAGKRGWFRCPCHGSTFTRGGLRVFGPAPYSMATIPSTRHRDGSLTARWKEPRRGGSDDPSRTAVAEPRLIGCPFGAAICGPGSEEQ